MKTKAECEVIVIAALALMVDDAKAETAEDLSKLATLLLSSIAVGLRGAVGDATTGDLFRFALGTIPSAGTFYAAANDGTRLQ